MSEKIVLITDYTWPSTDPEAEVLARIGAKILVAQSGAEEELLELVPQADAILTCFADVTPKVIEAGHKLQVVGRYGIGVDNIAVDTATSLGIPVTNVPVYCADEVAEHVLALLFASARAICKYDKAIRLDNWDLATGTPMYRISIPGRRSPRSTPSPPAARLASRRFCSLALYALAKAASTRSASSSSLLLS